ncbi:carboxypeptidase regulatory-like domain-containing protein [Chitinophagaceae bacterium MMS25-I14]
MTRTLRYLFLLLFIGIAGTALGQAGEIYGTVLDAQKQPAINAVITVDQGGIAKGGAVTDIDGVYSIKPLQPGRYNVKVNYAGHNPVTIQDVEVAPNQPTRLNFNLESNTVLKDVIIKYVRPIVSIEKPGGDKHLTGEQISRMPTRNTNDFAAQSIGAYQSKSGSGLNLGGARTSGTQYIIDGMMVNGASAINQSPDVIDQIDVMTSGLNARYGDASGGVISITTKGPSKDLRGGITLEHSVDGYNTNLASFNLSGPFASRKVNDIKKPIVGFFLSGDYRYSKDGNPTYGDNYVLSDDKLNQLRQNPLVAVPSSTGIPTLKYATEYITAADLQTQKARRDATAKTLNLGGKLDYEIVPGTNITAGGSFNYNSGQGYSRSLSLFAPDAIPTNNSYTGRGYLRFTQRLGKPGGKQEDNKISNAYYTVQADYQRDYSSSEDPDHKRNPFEYGYVGKFTENLVPVYAPGTDTASGGTQGITLLGYQQTGVSFQRSEINPNLANYTSQYLALGGQVPISLTNVPSNGTYLRNGDAPISTYGLWGNVGTPLSGYGYSRGDQFSLAVDASFDYKMNKMKHAIGFGLYYQQQSYRSYSITGSSLWGLMRLLTRSVVNNNLDYNNPIFIVNGKQYTQADVKNGLIAPGPNDTIFYNRRFSDSNQTVGGFDYNLRKKLGAGKGDYLQPDSYDPSTFSLDMFTADELLNTGNSLVSYYGYDYLGNIVNGQVNFNDFWTKKDANGNYTRPIGAYRPNYLAGYLTDNIRFKDINFNLGVRIERFDNNTKVMIDPYSLYPTYTAGGNVYDASGQIKGTVASHNLLNGGITPGGIGDGAVPYVNDNTSSNPQIIGYRQGDTWYDANGKEVSDPTVLKAQSGRDPQPYLQNPQAAKITEAGFDPSGSFTDYKPQVNAMPRISFSFPINDVAYFYAHYDIIYQRPSKEGGSFATPMDYLNWQYGTATSFGNSNLKPEKAIDYEFGFEQALSKLSAVTLKAFYKERKDQIQIRPYINAWPTTYYTYGNRDFSTTKGFGLQYELRRTNHIALTLAYTLQFAEGTGSNASSSGGGLIQYLVSAQLPNMRFPYALDYDSRHLLSANLDYRYADGEGPVIGGLHVLQNAGLNLLFSARSGEPYTKYVDATSLVATTSKTIDGGINGSRLPWHYMMDLKVDKDLALDFNRTKNVENQSKKRRKAYYLNVFARVSNLLNTRDVLGVYSYTGSYKDDGYLATPAGATTIASQTNAKSFVDLYNAALQNPGLLNNPRRIILGLNFNF